MLVNNMKGLILNIKDIVMCIFVLIVFYFSHFLNIIFNNALLNVTEKRKGNGIFYGVNDKYTIPGGG